MQDFFSFSNVVYPSYTSQNVSSNCLVIVDELGRGTSNEEGFGICHAVCEHLLTTKVSLLCSDLSVFKSLSSLYACQQRGYAIVQKALRDCMSDGSTPRQREA